MQLHLHVNPLHWCHHAAASPRHSSTLISTWSCISTSLIYIDITMELHPHVTPLKTLMSPCSCISTSLLYIDIIMQLHLHVTPLHWCHHVAASPCHSSTLISPCSGISMSLLYIDITMQWHLHVTPYIDITMQRHLHVTPLHWCYHGAAAASSTLMSSCTYWHYSTLMSPFNITVITKLGQDTKWQIHGVKRLCASPFVISGVRRFVSDVYFFVLDKHTDIHGTCQ